MALFGNIPLIQRCQVYSRNFESQIKSGLFPHSPGASIRVGMKKMGDLEGCAIGQNERNAALVAHDGQHEKDPQITQTREDQKWQDNGKKFSLAHREKKTYAVNFSRPSAYH
jgi:hypothetical protein